MINNKFAQPLVSVIMPVYNAAQYVSYTIESIMAQSYKNIEFIIVDDHSNDNKTKVILQSYKKKYPKIKIIYLRKNRGSGGDAAANSAFRVSKGEFVARIDSDDIALPERIEKQVKYLLAHPKCAVLGSSAYIINSENQVIGEKKVTTNHNEIYNNYFVFHPMINPTIMVRKSLLVNPSKDMYLTDTPPNNDYLTFIKRISQGAEFANLPDKLMYYRMHDKNDSLRNVRKTFRNSIKTRYRAILSFGYRPKPVAVIKFLIQVVMVYTLPQSLIFNLYLLVRGIKKPGEILSFSKIPILSKFMRVLNFNQVS